LPSWKRIIVSGSDAELNSLNITSALTASGSAEITGSLKVIGNTTITGSLVVTGQITAQTLNVQQVTSSIVYSSGSNIFGSSLSDTQQLTGSVSVTGSMNVNGTPVSVGTGSAGQVAFWNGTSSQTGDNGLFWDNTNKRLGLGTTTPGSVLDLGGGQLFINTNPSFQVFNSSDKILQIKGPNKSIINLVSDVNAVPGVIGGVFFSRANGTADAHVNVAGIQAVQLTTGGNAHAGLTFLVKGGGGIFQGMTYRALTNSSTILEIPTIGSTPSQVNINGPGGIYRMSADIGGESLFGAIQWFQTNFTSPGLAASIEAYRSPNNIRRSSIRFYTSDDTNLIERMRISHSNGNVIIQDGGTFTDAGFRLDVNGTARVQGSATITADSSVNNVSIGRGGGAVISNTRLGNAALSANTSGSTNTAVGGDALGSNTTGAQNTAFGYFALTARLSVIYLSICA
jgi:hypothetical protein